MDSVSTWRRLPARLTESVSFRSETYPGYELHANWAIFRDGVFRRVWQPKRVYPDGYSATIGELMPRTCPVRAAEELEEYIRDGEATRLCWHT